MEQALEKGIQEWGLVGAIVVACFMLLRQLILWMQSRIDSKDMQLAEQHAKSVEVAQSVIAMADKTAVAIDNMGREITGMGDKLCQRLDQMSGK